MDKLEHTGKYAKTQEEFFKKGFLMYKRTSITQRALIVFNKFEVLSSGFIRPLNAKVFGKEPLGIKKGDFIINPRCLNILHPKQDQLFYTIKISDNTSIRYFFVKNQIEAYEGLDAKDIVDSDMYGDMRFITLNNN